MKKIFLLRAILITFNFWYAKYELEKKSLFTQNLAEKYIKLKWTSIESKENINKKEYIIKLKSNSSSLNIKSQENLGNNLILIKLDENDTSLNSLKQNSNIEIIQPNYKYILNSIPNDEHFSKQRWLQNLAQQVDWISWISWADINMIKTWNLIGSWFKDRQEILALIDDWVWYDHPELRNSMRDGTNCIDENWNQLWWCKHWFDFENNDLDPISSTSSHWTHIAWIISAQGWNEIWVTGISNSIKIMALKAWNRYLTTDKIIKAIFFAQKNWAKIINASFWSSPLEDTSPLEENQDYLLYQAIKSFWEWGGIFVTSAWNNRANHDDWNSLSRNYPCDFWVETKFNDWTILTGLDNIICVWSSNQNDELATFSDRGKESVHILAPWKKIFSTMIWEEILYQNNFNNWTQNIITWSISWENLWWMANIWSGDNIFRTDIFAPPYQNNSNTYVQIENISKKWNKWIWIEFWWWCQGENSPFNRTDYIKVEWSNDWNFFKEISRFDYASDELYSSLTLFGKKWYQWYFEYDLSSFSWENIWIRFSWITDETDNNYVWCAIDDIIIKWYDAWKSWKYWYLEWTSMSTPYVAATAALWYLVNPSVANKTIIESIIKNADKLNWMENKIKSWWRLNSYKTILNLLQPQNKSVRLNDNWIINSHNSNWSYININWLIRAPSIWKYEIIDLDWRIINWQIVLTGIEEKTNIWPIDINELKDWEIKIYFDQIITWNNTNYFSWTGTKDIIKPLLEATFHQFTWKNEWILSIKTNEIITYEITWSIEKTVVWVNEFQSSENMKSTLTWEINLTINYQDMAWNKWFQDLFFLFIFSWSIEQSSWNILSWTIINLTWSQQMSWSTTSSTHNQTSTNHASNQNSVSSSKWSWWWVFFPALLNPNRLKKDSSKKIIKEEIFHKELKFGNTTLIKIPEIANKKLMEKMEKISHIILKIIEEKQINDEDSSLIADNLNTLFHWIWSKNLTQSSIVKIISRLKVLLKI